MSLESKVKSVKLTTDAAVFSARDQHRVLTPLSPVGGESGPLIAYVSGLVFYPDQTNAFCETVTGRIHRFMTKDHKKEFKKKKSKRNPVRLSATRGVEGTVRSRGNAGRAEVSADHRRSGQLIHPDINGAYRTERSHLGELSATVAWLLNRVGAMNVNKESSCIGFSPTLGGAVDKPTFVVVPFGWRRVVDNGRVIYISPDGSCLVSVDQVNQYLQKDGTCKCGLGCPLQVNKVFNFDPGVLVRHRSAEEVKSCQAEDDLTKLCNHKRKILAMATLMEPPVTTQSKPSFTMAPIRTVEKVPISRTHRPQKSKPHPPEDTHPRYTNVYMRQGLRHYPEQPRMPLQQQQPPPLQHYPPQQIHMQEQQQFLHQGGPPMMQQRLRHLPLAPQHQMAPHGAMPPHRHGDGHVLQHSYDGMMGNEFPHGGNMGGYNMMPQQQQPPAPVYNNAYSPVPMRRRTSSSSRGTPSPALSNKAHRSPASGVPSPMMSPTDIRSNPGSPFDAGMGAGNTGFVSPTLQGMMPNMGMGEPPVIVPLPSNLPLPTRTTRPSGTAQRGATVTPPVSIAPNPEGVSGNRQVPSCMKQRSESLSNQWSPPAQRRGSTSATVSENPPPRQHQQGQTPSPQEDKPHGLVQHQRNVPNPLLVGNDVFPQINPLFSAGSGNQGQQKNPNNPGLLGVTLQQILSRENASSFPASSLLSAAAKAQMSSGLGKQQSYGTTTTTASPSFGQLLQQGSYTQASSKGQSGGNFNTPNPPRSRRRTASGSSRRKSGPDDNELGPITCQRAPALSELMGRIANVTPGQGNPSIGQGNPPQGQGSLPNPPQDNFNIAQERFRLALQQNYPQAGGAPANSNPSGMSHPRMSFPQGASMQRHGTPAQLSQGAPTSNIHGNNSVSPAMVTNNTITVPAAQNQLQQGPQQMPIVSTSTITERKSQVDLTVSRTVKPVTSRSNVPMPTMAPSTSTRQEQGQTVAMGTGASVSVKSVVATSTLVPNCEVTTVATVPQFQSAASTVSQSTTTITTTTVATQVLPTTAVLSSGVDLPIVQQQIAGISQTPQLLNPALLQSVLVQQPGLVNPAMALNLPLALSTGILGNQGQQTVDTAVNGNINQAAGLAQVLPSLAQGQLTLNQLASLLPQLSEANVQTQNVVTSGLTANVNPVPTSQQSAESSQAGKIAAPSSDAGLTLQVQQGGSVNSGNFIPIVPAGILPSIDLTQQLPQLGGMCLPGNLNLGMGLNPQLLGQGLGNPSLTNNLLLTAGNSGINPAALLQGVNVAALAQPQQKNEAQNDSKEVEQAVEEAASAPVVSVSQPTLTSQVARPISDSQEQLSETRSQSVESSSENVDSTIKTEAVPTTIVNEAQKSMVDAIYTAVVDAASQGVKVIITEPSRSIVSSTASSSTATTSALPLPITQGALSAMSAFTASIPDPVNLSAAVNAVVRGDDPLSLGGSGRSSRCDSMSGQSSPSRGGSTPRKSPARSVTPGSAKVSPVAQVSSPGLSSFGREQHSIHTGVAQSPKPSPQTYQHRSPARSPARTPATAAVSTRMRPAAEQSEEKNQQTADPSQQAVEPPPHVPQTSEPLDTTANNSSVSSDGATVQNSHVHLNNNYSNEKETKEETVGDNAVSHELSQEKVPETLVTCSGVNHLVPSPGVSSCSSSSVGTAGVSPSSEPSSLTSVETSHFSSVEVSQPSSLETSQTTSQEIAQISSVESSQVASVETSHTPSAEVSQSPPMENCLSVPSDVPNTEALPEVSTPEVVEETVDPVVEEPPAEPDMNCTPANDAPTPVENDCHSGKENCVAEKERKRGVKRPREEVEENGEEMPSDLSQKALPANERRVGTRHHTQSLGIALRLAAADGDLEEADSRDSSPEPPTPRGPRNFSTGDLVWGQIRGFPSWPGKLVQENDVKGNHVKSEEGKVWVKWFGDHTYTQVEPDKLKTLTEGLEAHHKARKRHRKGRKMNSNLEAAIEEAMLELERKDGIVPDPKPRTAGRPKAVKRRKTHR
ncbi:positive regulation of growth hormone receptor signaling pathway [Branchiostoma belcheri]|nr:positive regulation of growth hormone receptor signaling pathway [Branchiostoma belcheri]